MSDAKSGENHPNYGKPRPQKTRDKISKANKGQNVSQEQRDKLAKPYPAFYNVLTGQYIPSGDNLTKLCKEYGLNYSHMWNLKKGITEQSMDGWKLAGIL